MSSLLKLIHSIHPYPQWQTDRMLFLPFPFMAFLSSLSLWQVEFCLISRRGGSEKTTYRSVFTIVNSTIFSHTPKVCRRYDRQIYNFLQYSIINKHSRLFYFIVVRCIVLISPVFAVKHLLLPWNRRRVPFIVVFVSNIFTPHFAHCSLTLFHVYFCKIHLKILSSQKRGGSRGVPFEPFWLPTPSQIFFEHP